MNLYTIRNIRKTFGTREVLNIPELTIEKGKINALLGANGTGKTTLLNILAFLDIPTEGEIFFKSSPVHFVEKKLKILRRKVIMLDQKPILFSTNVYKNLDFGLKVHKVSKKERIRRIEEALESIGMTKFREAPATSLSGGEAQRVAIARVLVLQPKVLLFDEPTSNIDSENQAIIIDLLRELNTKKNISIIFSTHDQNLSSALAHQTITLDYDRGGIIGENVFSCTLLSENGTPFGLLPCGLKLKLPRTPKSNNFLIRVKPQLIEQSEIIHNHKENVITGNIQQVTLQNKHLRVKIEAGSIFSLLCAQDKFNQSELRVGGEISLFIPHNTINVIE